MSSTSAALVDEILLEPDPLSWVDLVARESTGAFAGRTLAEWRSCTRAELGLAADGAVLATGHQPTIWHPGILAKYFALQSLADQLRDGRVQVVHLVVDQDVVDPTLIELPLLDVETADVVQVEWGRLSTPERAVYTQPAIMPADDTSADGWKRLDEETRANVLSLLEHLREQADARDLALQVTRAATAQLAEHWRHEPLMMRATQLLRTSFGCGLIEGMREQAEACTIAYNRAALAHASAGVKPLDLRGTVIELPLWRIDAAGLRHPVYAHDLEDDDLAIETLQPRALTMTAIVRIAVADLFIHGTGGRGYDRVMEQWIADWLGLQPKPMVTASADVRLAPARAEGVTVAKATWALHRWRHDPWNRRSDAGISSEKSRMLAAIERMPRGSAARYDAFRAMHKEIREEGLRQGDREAQLVAEVEAATRAERARTIATRRDWPFIAYPAATLAELDARIRGAFAHCRPGR